MGHEPALALAAPALPAQQPSCAEAEVALIPFMPHPAPAEAVDAFTAVTPAADIFALQAAAISGEQWAAISALQAAALCAIEAALALVHPEAVTAALALLQVAAVDAALALVLSLSHANDQVAQPAITVTADTVQTSRATFIGPPPMDVVPREARCGVGWVIGLTGYKAVIQFPKACHRTAKRPCRGLHNWAAPRSRGGVAGAGPTASGTLRRRCIPR
jgi:hypothetical protein